MIEARDVDAIAQAVESIIANKNDAIEKANQAYVWAIQTHAWDATLKKYEAFYQAN
jgi:glycosyltransferase involved in cell wall biosynthesis